MPQLVETLTEFIERHGNAPLSFDGGSTRVLPDGATLVPSWKPGGEPSQAEPPADAMVCLQLRLRYTKRKLELLETTFSEMKNTALGLSYTQTKWHRAFGPKPEFDGNGDESVFWLTKLRDLARAERTTLKSLETEYGQLPQVQQRQKQEAARRKVEAERAQAERARLDKITAINL